MPSEQILILLIYREKEKNIVYRSLQNVMKVSRKIDDFDTGNAITGEM
jgi:hypothetical protein